MSITQLKNGIKWLAQILLSRPDIAAIIIPGAIGGVVIHSLEGQRLQGLTSPGLVLSAILGSFSGIVLIGLITNTNRTDILRLVALTFLGGLAWPVVIDQGLNVLFGEDGPRPQIYTAAGELVAIAAALDKSDDVDGPARLERVASAFAQNLPEEGPLRDDVFDTILDRVAYLEEYQRRAAIDALEGHLPSLDVDETQRLENLRDGISPADQIETIVPNVLQDAPTTFSLIAEMTTLTTDGNGGVGFRTAEASRYEIQTNLFLDEEDLVAALYLATGGQPILIDDDSGQDVNPLIATTLQADQNYVLKLFEYYTGQVAEAISVSFMQVPE